MSKMERDKAEQYVWKITEYYDHMNDLDSAIDLLNEYANQLIIEELNSIASFCQGATEEMIYEAVTKRIQELKQD